jgi:hypothetical protein
MAALITLFILDAICIGTAIYCGWQATKYDYWTDNKHKFYSGISTLCTVIGVFLFILTISVLLALTVAS